MVGVPASQEVPISSATSRGMTKEIEFGVWSWFNRKGTKVYAKDAKVLVGSCLLRRRSLPPNVIKLSFIFF